MTIPAARLADAGADLVELGEEGQVEGAAQEVDARGAAGAGLVADRALHDLEVAEAPLLEVVLDVDELLAGLVDAPVLLGRGVDARRTSRPASGFGAVGLRPVAVEALGGYGVPLAREVGQELVVQRRLEEQRGQLRRARRGRGRRP